MTSQTWFDGFMADEARATPQDLAWLDRGLAGSPWERHVASYPARLARVPPPSPLTPSPPLFPCRGGLPSIDEGGLHFLHPDVVAACVAVGRIDHGGNLRAHWHGRNASESMEMWSATKVVPVLRTVALENRASTVAIHAAAVRDPAGTTPDQAFTDVLADIVTYCGGDDLSNAQARMLKHFDTAEGLEAWVRSITGNHALRFRGGYGVRPTLPRPLLVERGSGRVLLESPGREHTGDNAMSACDLARILAMIGWDAQLPEPARLPDIRRSDLACVSRALGADRARYLDAALACLDLAGNEAEGVVLSKMGFGESLVRHATEGVYAAFVRHDDPGGGARGLPLMVALALKVARPSSDADACFVVDARMAASVTEILERVATGLLP